MGYDPSTRQGEGLARGVGVGGEDDAEEHLARPEGEEEEAENEAALSASAEMEAKLKELSRNPEVYDILSRSMAPSIYEMDDVKKGILLQLFGGTNKSIAKGGGGGGPRYRGDINVLVVGDPGTSKSQILQVSFHPTRASLVEWYPDDDSTFTKSHLEVSIPQERDLRLSVSLPM
jgi:DNA replication licensing factor MCM4